MHQVGSHALKSPLYKHRRANRADLFFPGMMWPLDAVIAPVRDFCWLMPLTAPSEALRHVVHRGWDFTNTTPQLALLSSSVWTILVVIALLVILRYKQK